jgi:hypothetical protein
LVCIVAEKCSLAKIMAGNSSPLSPSISPTGARFR